jgi:6-phosphogluconolactonase
MQLDVYQTDAEVFEAAAAVVAACLATAARGGRASAALPGGRGGRAFMLALAGRSEVSWAGVDLFFTDEYCLPDGDPRRTLHVARESLLGPRGVPAERVHAIEVGGRPPAVAAREYGALLVGALGEPPVLDVAVVELGGDGEIAALLPGSAPRRDEPVIVVEAAPGGGEPHVARVSITAAVLRAARRVVVFATGATRAGAVAAALRDPVDLARRPAQAILPSDTVTWFVDRAAADLLLRDARPATDAQ